MLTAHCIALDVNNNQETYLAKACGVARFAYNWALAQWNTQYEEYKKDRSLPKPSETALRRLLNSIKRKQFPWMLEVTKNAPQMAIIQLGKAFQNFFSGRTQYPQFRKKGKHDRFTLTNDQFSVKEDRIRMPHIGWVRMQEVFRFTGKILSATISRKADRWFVSIAVETTDVAKNQPIEQLIGIDLGVSAIATLSSGEKMIGVKPHAALLSRLKRLAKTLSRKVKGSKNRNKAKIKLARLHARIANIRLDAMHKFTTSLVQRYRTICIEDLQVQNMVKNRSLSRSISDRGFRELRRQLEYKTARNGNQLIVADRYFPSSKICSNCGHILTELALRVRQWDCPHCSATHDRDINAAKNLAAYAVSSTVNKPVEKTALTKWDLPFSETVSVKQEVNTK